MYEVIILSVVQGITEFLPISSSAHLIFISSFFEFKLNSLILDISLHSGSLAAILIYFKKDIINLKKNINFFYKIILSSIPVIIFGYLIVRFNIITLLRDVKIIAIMSIIFAVFLFYCDNQNKKQIHKGFDLRSLVIIGLFQVLSLIPGVSRSGVTISIARLLNFNRSDSAKISFFLSIPILGITTMYNLYILSKLNDLDLSKINFLAFALSFIFSYITIKYFLNFIRKNSFNFFVIYRILFGVIILLYLK